MDWNTIQSRLHDFGFYPGAPDGDPGRLTREAIGKALDLLSKLNPAPGGVTLYPSPAALATVHKVKASSFADPADVLAFKRCKAEGKSNAECFKVGDNGIGKWGDDTTVDSPMCALPYEDWQALGGNARGAKVLVKANGREVVCELMDTMPHKANIKNGAGIDLNPAAVAVLGLKPPIMIPATWEWLA